MCKPYDLQYHRAQQKELQIENYQCQHSISEYQYIYWDFENRRFKKIKYEVSFTKEKQIKYIQNGQVLRIEQAINSLQKPDILTNLEQIKYLQWSGKYGQNTMKIGRWSATWNKDIILESGGYYSEDGQKQGLWRDLTRNYWSEAKVYEIGLYIDNKRSGKWKYIYNNNEIGGGFYDEQGEKIGKWIELSEYFWKQGYVVYDGEYKNGKRYGVWNVLHKRNGQKQLKLIGFGSYENTQEDDLILDSVKVGKWVELNYGFWDLAQILHTGTYKEGKKIGRWDILYRISNNKPFEIIGGGTYDDRLEGQVISSSLKNGKWIELIEGFWRDNQITYKGEYHNGVKVGQWDIYYYNEDTEDIELTGGGSYIEKVNDQNIVSSVKIGKWIELIDNFESEIQVTFIGEYDNGKKVGRWDTFYKKEQLQN
ncbi:unnamed protein product (macronuclear) [Paramecium tetraurelia]|uniref:MORN repeat protein n=1 Tax=Paramecium tetraurelia TaxID=5888 RepID=A0BQN7_PARTE|nr:uncharacterized protein GSPATT00031083001 [Paramecium tetraurelia]CAK60854.1 unnamed protein product [Paramecium tetraurelia]|eukprot:XP_001428252.1 hypothetical protein (macronuclear) [Paramecium tetraurelia strain d4-2]